MPHDIDQVIARVQQSLPVALVRQLTVKHEADDDGLWFFSLPGADDDIQVESSSYNCPFIVEFDSTRLDCLTIQETANAVVQYLNARSTG